MTAPYTGRCACGQVRLRIESEPLALRQCWCRQCQQVAAGSPTNNALFVGLEVWFFQSGMAETIARALLSVSWLFILGGFILLSWLASMLAVPTLSRLLQYIGFLAYVVIQAVIFVPLLYVADQSAPGVIASAA